MTKTKTDTFFDRFFDEKEIPFTTFEIEHGDTVHFIDTDVVIEGIRSAPRHEKKQVENMLRRLDFHNAPIVPFLEHLAKAMIKVRFADSEPTRFAR